MFESRSSACFFLIVVLAFSPTVNLGSVFPIVNHSLDFLYSNSFWVCLAKNLSMNCVKVETFLVLAVPPGPSELKNNFRLIFHCVTCCPLFWAWNVYAFVLCLGLPFCTFCWTCVHFPRVCGTQHPAAWALQLFTLSCLRHFQNFISWITFTCQLATALCLLAVYPSTFIVLFFTDFTVQIGCLICSIIFYSDLS